MYILYIHTYENVQCNIHVYFVFIERIYIYMCLKIHIGYILFFSYINVHIDIYISTSTRKAHQNQKHPRNAEV